MTDKPVALRFQIELDLEMLVFEERGEPENPEENLSEQGREPTTNSTTYDAEFGNRTWAALVGGECCHHCAIPAPLWCCVGGE